MEQEPDPSVEIGHARQMVFSSGRPTVVVLGSSSPAGASKEETTHGNAVSERQDLAEIKACSSREDPDTAVRTASKRTHGPRVLLMLDDTDAWSTFANPECSHERYCGHMARPRVLFRPDGIEPVRRHFETPADPRSGQMGSGCGSEGTSELPSRLGPFLLESSSKGSSVAEGFCEGASTGLQQGLHSLGQESIANRTAAWLVNLTPEIPPLPENPPSSASLDTDSENPANMQGGSGTDPIRPRRERYQPPDDSALRGNFIPLSTSLRKRSPSPRREQEPHGVYLQLSLTDSQMDRLTAALSAEDSEESSNRGRGRHAGNNTDPLKSEKEDAAPGMRSRSPTKMHSASPSRARSRSPVKFANMVKTPESFRTVRAFVANRATQSPSREEDARYARNNPSAEGTPAHRAERRARSPPAPIDTDIARIHAKLSALRAGRQPPVAVQQPPERDRSPVRQRSQIPTADDSSSFYSQDSTGERYPSCISPLRIQKDDEPKHLSILQGYMDKRNTSGDSGNASSGAEQARTTDEASSGAERPYTPLAAFLPDGIPTFRKASKTLIGENGWLENTSKPAEQTTSPTRGGGFLGNLVKKAKEMIEAGHDNRAQRRSRDSDKSRPASRQLAISLTPREQSLLYCELEFAVTTALNDYITAQFNSGRLEADRLKKVAEDWQRKGRPRVVGFRYDMETQLELVRLHVHDFKFYSRVAATTAILGILDTMKANARVLRVRTFCQPDTVVAKQLLDSQSLFNILGCPEDQHIKLAEIVAFFKAAVERERIQAAAAAAAAAATASAAQQAPGGGGGGVGGATAAASPPPRQSKSSRVQTDEWWGTGAAGNVRRAESHQGGYKMDPAGYDSQNE